MEAFFPKRFTVNNLKYKTTSPSGVTGEFYHTSKETFTSPSHNLFQRMEEETLYISFCVDRLIPITSLETLQAKTPTGQYLLQSETR